MNRIRKENINTVEFWDNEWAMRPDVELIERFTVVAELLRRENAKKILDVGCGSSIGYAHIKRHWGCDYYGTDFSEVAIAKAKELEPGAHFAVADAYQQPFDDNSFDAVLCQEVFEHLEDPVLLATELLRCTRPGGAIIITTPLGEYLNGCPEHIWAYSKDDIRKLFTGCPVRFLNSKMILFDLIVAVITKPV